MNSEPHDKLKKPQISPPALLEINEHIGRKLRQMYDHIAQQPVPDHLLKLLDKLDSVEKTKHEA